MINRAIGYIARTGPISQQDRWEENSGINTFTLAVCIAALVEGAEWLDARTRQFILDLADYWNAHIEAWTAVYGTDLARRIGVHGYYIRNAPTARDINPRALLDVLPVKNQAGAQTLTAEEQVGIDFLQLVRFGLRRADDPLIVDSLRVVDELLKVDTPNGPSWHRYNGDGYGEHDDGTPFDGVGQGRVWPLLTGERGHYELAAGKDPLPYLQAMVAMSGAGGMIPEQVWDSEPIPEKNLFAGRPTGSAMPLVWAHAEYIKLLISRQLGHPCDQPEITLQRYQGKRPEIKHAVWLPQDQILKISSGQILFIAMYEACVIHWSLDGWQSALDTATRDTGLGLHLVELDTQALRSGQVDFTTRRADTGEWLGRNYSIEIENS
jgi:glucoamylase